VRKRALFQARFVRTILVTGLSITMIATGGFGTMPNPFSQQVAQVMSNAMPTQLGAPLNNILADVGAPPLPMPEPSPTRSESLLDQLFAPGQPNADVTTAPASTETPSSTPTLTVTPTATMTATATSTATATPTVTSTPTATGTATRTATVTPTRTYLPTWTPPPADTPLATPTSTATPTPGVSPVPAGHYITSLVLNGGGNSVTVVGGSTVTVDYTYQVWGDASSCFGCNFQLVWGLDNNWQYCSAWISPSPGDFPGQSGAGSQFTITAPAMTGSYTIYSFSGQYADCTAAITNYTSAAGTAEGTISVP
jgi:hypothetical protein